MHPARQQFGQIVGTPSSQGQGGQPTLKRSHIVAIAAVGLVAVAGGVAASRSGSPAQEVVAPTTDATTATASSQQPSSGRSLLFLPIPFFGRSTAAAPPAAAQASVQRGGFGGTSQTMASTPTRSATGG